MDPQICADLIVECVARKAMREAIEHLEDLATWCRGGGFRPDLSPEHCKVFAAAQEYRASQTA